MTINESIKLKLLLGSPFQIDNICSIKPLTLRQIVEIGHDKYNYYLSNLTAEVEDYNIPNIDSSQYTYWDVLVTNMIHGDISYYQMIIEAINLFVGDRVEFDRENGWFCTKEKNIRKEIKEINKEIFDEIRQVLRWQNCIEKKSQEKMANSKAEEIRQKILKGRQELNKKNKNEVTFDDLISVLAAHGNNLNILNIWDLTMYQFNNQFNRMQMIEDYDINIRYLLAGAKGDDIKLKHYIRPINANI